MPAEKTYLDRVNVKNLTNRPITLGDLVNVTIPANTTVDLLKQPRVTKEKINQSQHLQIALRSKWIKIIRTKRNTRTANEKKASVAWEEDILDLNLNNLSDDDILQYDRNSGKWENVQPEDTEGSDKNVTIVTDNYTIRSLDDLILVDASSNNITISVPSATSNPGKEFDIKKIDSTSNEVIVDAYNAETIDGELTQIIDCQYDTMDIVSTSTNWVII